MNFPPSQLCSPKLSSTAQTPMTRASPPPTIHHSPLERRKRPLLFDQKFSRPLPSPISQGPLDKIVSKKQANPNSPSGIVDNVLDNTPDVTVLLRKVDVPQPGRRLVVVGVGLEDPSRLSLRSDDSLPVSLDSFSWVLRGSKARRARGREEGGRRTPILADVFLKAKE